MASKEKKEKIPKTKITYLWEDRRRHLGLPLSFTKYKLSEDRLFLIKGFLNITVEEIQLYRIRDMSMKLPLGQRLFGTGTIIVSSSDTTSPTLELRCVKHPSDVKELLNGQVEKVKIMRNVRLGDIVGGRGLADSDHDGIPDYLDHDPDDGSRS